MGVGLLELLLEDTHNNRGGSTACGTMANGRVGGLLEGGHLLHQRFQEGLQVHLALVDPLLELGIVHQGLMCQVPRLLGELLQFALGILVSLGSFDVLLLLLWLSFDLLFIIQGQGRLVWWLCFFCELVKNQPG